MFVQYDVDTNMLWLALRGSSLCEVYDVNNIMKASELSRLSQQQVSSDLKGICLIPKSACSLVSSLLPQALAFALFLLRIHVLICSLCIRLVRMRARLGA